MLDTSDNSEDPSHKTMFFTTCKDLEIIINEGMRLWQKIPSPKENEIWLQYCLSIFRKQLGHASSLHDLLPKKEHAPGEYWDISSYASLSRCIMEAYDSLAYIALQPTSDDERVFRICLWRANDADRRLQMYRLLHENIGDHVFQWQTAAVSGLKKSPFFVSLEPDFQDHLLKKFPPFHLSQKDRNEISNINHDRYRHANQMLSQHVHTYSFAIHQSDSRLIGGERVYRDAYIGIFWAVVFLTKTISDISLLFQPALSVGDQATAVLGSYLPIIEIQ